MDWESAQQAVQSDIPVEWLVCGLDFSCKSTQATSACHYSDSTRLDSLHNHHRLNAGQRHPMSMTFSSQLTRTNCPRITPHLAHLAHLAHLTIVAVVVAVAVVVVGLSPIP
jgi:hypothetical protein